MRSIRRRFASVLTGFALLGIASAADAAGPPTIPQQQQHYYIVYYRTCPHDSWHMYGWTPDANTAAYHVNVLHSNGYEAFYR